MKRKAVRRKKSVAPRPGRPARKLVLPVNGRTDADYWINMVSYLNKNKNKSYVIQLDGTNYLLSAD